MKFENEFKQLYRKLCLGVGEEWYPLGEKCSNCKECWKKLGNDAGKKYQISMPWVGDHYEKAKILAIGINFNGHGGINGYQEVIDLVKGDFRKGKKKTCSNPDYPGSLFHHRMSSYCTAILDKIKPEGWKNSGAIERFPDFECLIGSLEYIAHTNLIKCSRDSERGKPSNAMWENCPGMILKEEIKILKPDILVILGDYVGKYVIEPLISKGNFSYPCSYETGFRRYSAVLEYMQKPVQIFDFYHTSAFGGNKLDILRKLQSSLQ